MELLPWLIILWMITVIFTVAITRRVLNPKKMPSEPGPH